MSYKAKIYFVEDDKKDFVSFEETNYAQESDLQELLANYPDLIPGAQIDPENPRRWILVSREMGVPDGQNESNRWSLDHLFLDQDGIPTFIECKRTSDTRNRREVVAQMLDYAANGTEYWKTDKLRQISAEVSLSRGMSLDEEIIKLIDNSADLDTVEDYWNTVENNLKERKIRLIFVSDSAPKELRRLVEFLNEEMANIEVLAVEIKSYKGIGENNSQVLVPQVIGLTETIRSQKKKQTTKQTKLAPDEFFAKCSPDAENFYRQLITSAQERGFIIKWASAGFSIRTTLGKDGQLISFLYGVVPDEFQFFFDTHGTLPREQDSPLRVELKELGIFSEKGKYTLSTHVSEFGTERLKEVSEFIFDKINSFV